MIKRRAMGWMDRVHIPAEAKDFTFSKIVKTGSGDHPTQWI